MFDNIGKKIKAIASTLFTIMLILSVILAITVGSAVVNEMWLDGFEAFFVFVLVLVVIVAIGGLIAYLSVIMTYAFGELVDNSTIIAGYLTGTNKPTENPSTSATLRFLQGVSSEGSIVQKKPSNTTSAYWKCPTCGKENYQYVGTCGCGQRKPN